MVSSVNFLFPLPTHQLLIPLLKRRAKPSDDMAQVANFGPEVREITVAGR